MRRSVIISLTQAIEFVAGANHDLDRVVGYSTDRRPVRAGQTVRALQHEAGCRSRPRNGDAVARVTDAQGRRALGRGNGIETEIVDGPIPTAGARLHEA